MKLINLGRFARRCSFVVAVASASAQAQSTDTDLSCSFEREAGGFSGTCSVPCLVDSLKVTFAGSPVGATCSAPDHQVKAAIRPASASGHWLGTMEGRFPEDPTRFELIDPRPDRGGVAKTPFGWFAVKKESTQGKAMVLTIDASRQLPPTQDDLRILDRARQLLSTEALWNRQDTRECPKNASKVSLFCALRQATAEVSGGVHYRQPALQAVREVVDHVAAGTISKHRLMEYNNAAGTRLVDIQAILTDARTQIERDMQAK